MSIEETVANLAAWMPEEMRDTIASALDASHRDALQWLNEPDAHNLSYGVDELWRIDRTRRALGLGTMSNILIPADRIRRALELLQDLQNSDDPEVAHVDADDALLTLIGNDEIRVAFEDVPKWYA